MDMRLTPRLFLPALALGAALALASPAAAHVEPDVTEVPAGAAATVEFHVEHGCEGSPTVKLELRVPADVTDAAPVEKPGWTGAVTDRVVTFAGGSLPDDQEDAFSITFTAPSTVGTVLRFPMIQTCEQGTLEWIQTDEEAERPAPAVKIVAAEPGTGTTTTAATATTATSATTSSSSDLTGPADGDAQDDGDDSGSSLPWVLGGIVVVGVAGGGLWFARRNRAA